jgi:predicted ATPase
MNNLRSIKLRRDEINNWEDHPFKVPAIKSFTELEIKSKIVFFVGENGSGKSTLLEAIADNFGFSKQGGSKNINFESTDEVYTRNLADKLTLVWRQKLTNGFFLRAESLFNMANYIDDLSKDPWIGSSAFTSFGGISLHQHSHGESFKTVFENQFHKNGFYLLDEPEAALSPKRQLELLVLLNELLKKEGNIQFIIATHSPIILSFPNAQIFDFNQGKITEVDYKDTEVYQVTKGFLDNTDYALKNLLDN